jgi:hypothetical protein
VTWLAEATLDTVVVHTTHGQSIKGNLRTTYSDSLVLTEARVLLDEGMSQQLNGEIVVPRERVHYIQTVPPEVT